jgi:acyl-ACP thioesterase
MAIFSFDFNLSVMQIGEKNKLTNKGILLLLQEAASKASTIVGYGPNDAAKTHIAWILLNWKLKIFSRPNWDSKITIKTWPRNMIKYYSARDFEIYDDKNNLIAIASSKWVLINTETGKISKIDDEIVSKYDCLNKSVFEDGNFDKIPEPKASTRTFEHIIQRREIDTNHHVNNTNYIDYAYEALPQEIYDTVDFQNVEILYKHEAKYEEKINCFYSKLETGEHIVAIKNAKSDTLHAIVKLY